MLNKRIVITGLGMLSPLGSNVEKFWNNASRGENAIAPSHKLKGSDFELYEVGEIQDFNLVDYFSPRKIKKLDKFTLYALIAVQEALQDSQLDLANINKENIGVYVGNRFGGWEFTERELRNLHCMGVQSINPHLATAWFPAAPQGEISIFHGFKGHSKTIDCDQASSLASIGYAAQAIQMGRLDYAIAGGTEAMLTPFMMTARQNELVKKDYQPFGKNGTGYVPAEGAGFVLLESLASAIARDAYVYGEIKGFSQTGCPEETLLSALSEAQLDASQIDLILANGIGIQEKDFQEMQLFSRIFSPYKTKITVPKSMFGHAQGASGAMEVIMASLSLKNQCILPTLNNSGFDNLLEFSVVTDKAVPSPINNILIHSEFPEGNCAMIMSVFDKTYNGEK